MGLTTDWVDATSTTTVPIRLYTRLNYTNVINFTLVNMDENCNILYQYNKEKTSSNDQPVIGEMWGVMIMVAITLLYLPFILLIFINRNKQTVHFKSPLLIVTGSIALYIDSICNVYIMLIQSSKVICFLSIFDTLTVHYISFFAIIFRDKRIFRVM